MSRGSAQARSLKPNSPLPVGDQELRSIAGATPGAPVGRQHMDGFVDEPQPLGSVADGRLWVRGWAHGLVSPVSSIEVWLDGRCLGSAGLGRLRPDVAEALSEPTASLRGFE